MFDFNTTVFRSWSWKISFFRFWLILVGENVWILCAFVWYSPWFDSTSHFWISAHSHRIIIRWNIRFILPKKLSNFKNGFPKRVFFYSFQICITRRLFKLKMTRNSGNFIWLQILSRLYHWSSSRSLAPCNSFFINFFLAYSINIFT